MRRHSVLALGLLLSACGATAVGGPAPARGAPSTTFGATTSGASRASSEDPTEPPSALVYAAAAEPLAAATEPSTEPSTEPTTEPLSASTEPSTEPTELPPPRVREIDLDGMYALEVVIGGAGFDDPLPTVWAFHGRGDRPRVPGGPFDRTSRPYRVVVPRGPLPLGAEYSWLPVRVAEGRTEELTAALLARVDDLAQAIRRHAARVPYVGRAIVTGFSQGGVLSFALAILRPDLVGFALPNAGWLPPSLAPAPRAPAPRAPARYPPLRSTHGTADSIIAYEPTRALIERLRAAGLDAELEPFEGVGHTMSEGMNDRFHAWLEEALERARGEASDAHAP